MVTTVALLTWVGLWPFMWRRIYILAYREEWTREDRKPGVPTCSVFFSSVVWPMFFFARFWIWFYKSVIARETPDERKARLAEIAARCEAENAAYVAGEWPNLPSSGPGRRLPDPGIRENHKFPLLPSGPGPGSYEEEA